MNRIFVAALGLLFVILPCLADDASSLDPLIEVLAISEEAQFQLDILKGISAALKGQRNVPEPEGWPSLANRLVKSPNTEVAELALALSLKFGSQKALDVLRSQLEESSLGLAKRERVLEALVEAKDAKLPSVLLGLLDDSSLQRAALRGLAVFEDPKISGGILILLMNLLLPCK